MTGRTCGGFASYGPSSRTHSIRDLLQQVPASPAAADICDSIVRTQIEEGDIYIRVKTINAKSENRFVSKY